MLQKIKFRTRKFLLNNSLHTQINFSYLHMYIINFKWLISAKCVPLQKLYAIYYKKMETVDF